MAKKPAAKKTTKTTTKPAAKKPAPVPDVDPEVLAAREELIRLRQEVTDPHELEVAVAEAVHYHHSVGQPEVATKIKLSYGAGTPLTYHQLRVDGVHPFEEVVPEIEEPERHGPGSSLEAWQEFAKVKASDIMDEETIDSADRDDLVAMLEANGIIERSG